MTTAIKSAISPFAQLETEPNANAIRFLDEKLASVPASGIPEDFRKLSRFIPVIVLVPKPSFEDCNGRAVTLTSKEFKTLAYLIKNARRVISRDERYSNSN